MKISLIIATYNRGEKLLRTLRSLVNQTLDRSQWEVVVVNNNSSDNTRQVAENFAADHSDINMKVLFEAQQGLSPARNCGIANSSGEVIAIIDDDELVVDDFLRLYVDFFERHAEAAGAGGRITPVYETDRPDWMSSFTERPVAGTLDLGDTERPFPEGKFFGGGNMAVRRSAIERYGAFNPDLGRTGAKLSGGEEKDLYLRMKSGGEMIYYLPTAEIKHIIPESKLQRDYFVRLCTQVGASERVRTLGISRRQYAKRLAAEAVKWAATLVLAAYWSVTGRWPKAQYVVLMRSRISAGLLGHV